MQESSLKILFDNYLRGHADEARKDQFFQMVEQPQYHPELKELMDEYLRSAQAEEVMPEPMFRKIMQNIGGVETYEAMVARNVQSYPETASVKPLYKKLLPYAAAVLLIIAGVLYFRPIADNNTVQPESVTMARDIGPGKDRAVLTLSDGSRMVLENTEDGSLPDQRGVQLTKKNGTLYYADNGEGGAGASQWNTLSTPAGGKYKLKLPDGSWAWLNASSSIRYPVAFHTTERKVEVTGEVYFAVKDSAAAPFIVNVRDNQIRVLGTQFNVKAYDNEKEVQVTLIDGKLQVKKGMDSVLLKPGQQVLSEEKITVRDSVNLQKIYAWKEDHFYFYNDSIEDMMRQLARWYNINVEYAGAIPDILISGRISRDITLADVLDVFAHLGIRWEMKTRRTLVILPAVNGD